MTWSRGGTIASPGWSSSETTAGPAWKKKEAIRITENGKLRITENGKLRITEKSINIVNSMRYKL